MTDPTIYPWNKTPDGGYFFVPAVNAERVRKEGLIAAMRFGIHAKAQIGIYGKYYGVLFQRITTMY